MTKNTYAPLPSVGDTLEAMNAELRGRLAKVTDVNGTHVRVVLPGPNAKPGLEWYPCTVKNVPIGTTGSLLPLLGNRSLFIPVGLDLSLPRPIPIVTGNWIVGRWLFTHSTTGAAEIHTQTPITYRTYGVAFYCPQTVNVDALSINIVASAVGSSLGKLAIWEADGNGFATGSTLVETTISTTDPGVKVGEFTPITLTGGKLYVLAYMGGAANSVSCFTPAVSFYPTPTFTVSAHATVASNTQASFVLANPTSAFQPTIQPVIGIRRHS